MDGYLGQIMMFGAPFAPLHWAFCDGQLLPISSNSSLFALLGNTYGGDGRTTFALPDLRGRVPIHSGTGPGLPTMQIGQRGGSEANILTEAQMPSHNHQVSAKAKCVGSNGNAATPAGNIWAIDASGTTIAYSNKAADAEMNANAIEVQQHNKGSNLAVNNMQPYLAVNYIICVSGLFPLRQ
ncbi:phage tail protein [Agarivorans sp. MS3-6]|uniref:phage tail protein n=1 Tax=Agarivorans sp. TSD2052 TaxID=2937286 RepID=UPI00200FA8F3|nr:tail fiber protein [Agarivorans sp. TSD2052]UPW18653.1 tail fiber protein [Agarivorans sp. TSD2052]